MSIDRDERRERARQNGAAPSTTTTSFSTCLCCCYGPVPAGEVACSPECDSIWYGVVPLADGELYLPPQRPAAGAHRARPARRG